jgi:hypothetical protein
MTTPTPSPTHTPPALSIEAFPLVVKAPTGGAVHYTVTVRNDGTHAIDVTATTGHLGGACEKLTFSPAKFELAPGQQQHVTVGAPAGVAEDYLSEFSGKVHGSSGINVSAAVGTRLIVGKPSAGASCAVKATTPVPPAASVGFPLWAYAVVAVVVLAAVVVVIRKIRNRGNHGIQA